MNCNNHKCIDFIFGCAKYAKCKKPKHVSLDLVEILQYTEWRKQVQTDLNFSLVTCSDFDYLMFDLKITGTLKEVRPGYLAIFISNSLDINNLVLNIFRSLLSSNKIVGLEINLILD